MSFAPRFSTLGFMPSAISVMFVLLDQSALSSATASTKQEALSCVVGHPNAVVFAVLVHIFPDTNDIDVPLSFTDAILVSETDTLN